MGITPNGVLGPSEDSQYSNPWSCSSIPRVVDTGSPLDGELSGYNTEGLTMEGNMFGECQAPCMLSFVDFYKE